MQPEHHAEHRLYLRWEALARRGRQVVSTWKLEGKPITVEKFELFWTPDRAVSLAQSLSRLFEVYNAVLWQHFPYCRLCGGQCCVVHAAEVSPFDALALGLLDLPFPSLADHLEITPRACIFLTRQGCSWHRKWRTLKCWAFYCLGPQGSQADLYQQVLQRLKRVIARHLPMELCLYEQAANISLSDLLVDPISFVQALNTALDEIIVQPLDRCYPWLQDAIPSVKKPTDRLSQPLELIAATAHQADLILQKLPAKWKRLEEQVLSDLELFEWIVLYRPAGGLRMLEEAFSRYTRQPHEATRPLMSQVNSLMRSLALQLWKIWNQEA